MSKTLVKPRTKVQPRTQRPPLYKVILLNDDYTPREFVVQVLKAVFRMNADQAYRVMMTAHRRGACVIAVYTGTWPKPRPRKQPSSARARAIRCSSRPSRRVGGRRPLARCREFPDSSDEIVRLNRAESEIVIHSETIWALAGSDPGGRNLSA
jgi:ATP-dependent Clp protease adaptor protein ClpS